MTDSKTMAEAAPEKKRGGLMIKLLLAILLIAITAGGTFYLFSSGMIGGAKASSAPAEAPPPELSYYQFERAFTFNEKNGLRLIQLSISISARGAEPLAERLDMHEPALRSALLQVMMEVTREDLTGPPARTQLRAKLRDTLNRELKQRTGTGGVNEVLFTDVIIQ